MTKDEALKLALEALEFANVNHWWGSSNIEQAITAIKAALAQPEQEPIAKVCHDLDGHIGWNPTAQVNEFPEGMELFAAPLPVQPEERNFCPRCGKRTAIVDLSTIHTCTPPQEKNA